MIKVLIADDHNMFVDGIESILKDQQDIEVAAKCFDGGAVFRALEEHDIDVILLDINLPVLNGIQVTQRMRESYPHIKILALSMYNDESFITEILKYGALGYILKNTGKSELVKAIQLVNQGKSYFSPAVTETIMGSLVAQRKASSKKSSAAPRISRREKEVLDLIIKEHTTQEIADKLFISLKTVESHRRSLLTKLNVRNTAGLVRVAIEENLVEH